MAAIAFLQTWIVVNKKKRQGSPVLFFLADSTVMGTIVICASLTRLSLLLGAPVERGTKSLPAVGH